MNRKLYLFIFLLLCVFVNKSSAQSYCTPSYTFGCNSGDPVVSFSTTGGSTNITNNNSNCTNLNGTAFSIYSGTGFTHTASPGDVVNFSFVVGNSIYNEAVGIWVDWNDDGDFVDLGETVYSAINTQINPGVTTTGSFTVPLGAPAVTTKLRIRCSDFGPSTFDACSTESFGETEDYVFITQSLVPCSGQPSVTAASSVSSVCANTGFTLNTLGAVGLGYTFQWQSAPPCTNSFTNIPGATAINYNVAAGITTTTQYRVIVTCTNSSLIDTSAAITVTLACYCVSSAATGAGADIGRIKISNATYSYANPVNMPSPLTNNPTSQNGYTNYTGLPPVILTPGVQYRDSVTRINSGAVTSQYLQGWIDYNQDGTFAASELIVNTGGNSLATPNSHFGTFTVPTTALVGYTRMRHVLGVFGSVSACGNYGSGETEDYTVFIAPPAPTATNNGPVCSSQQLQLTATPSITCATYSWTGPNGYTSTQQNPIVSNPQGGSYCVSYTYDGITYGPSCTTVVAGQSTHDTTQVSICSGQSVIINGNPVSTAGYYNTTYTNIGGCDSVITSHVTVNPAPAAPGVTTPVNYCQNAVPSQLTAIGTGLQWYDAPTGGNLYPGAPTPSTASIGQTTYYVSQTSGGCEGPRAAIVVNVYAIPAIGGTTAANPTSCNGTQGSITLTGLTSGVSYTVNYLKNGIAQPALTIVANASGNVVIPTLAAGNYTAITVTVNGCTSTAAGPVALTDPAAPATIAGNNGPLCAGSTLNLTATAVAGGIYSWTGPNSFTSSLQNPTIASATALNSGIYSVTVTLNGCTSVPSTTNAVVNPNPTTPVASSNSPVCSGTSINLFATNVAGATYSWTGPNSFTSSLQNPTIAPATAAEAGTYSVTASIGACTSGASTVNVVVNPTPVAPTTTGVQYCQAGTASPLTATGTTGTLKWYDAPIGGTLYPGTPTPSTALAGSTTYYVSQTVNGCESARTPLVVDVIAKPAPPVVATPVLLCQGQATTPLTATGTALQWYTQAVGGTALAGAPTPSSATIGTTNYYVSQTVNGCESDRALIAVTVATTPVAPVVNTNPVVFCIGQTGMPSLNTYITGSGLTWYTQPSGGTALPGTPVISTASTDTLTYYVSQVFGICEGGRSPITIEIRDVSATPGVSDITYCQFQTASPLSAIGTGLQWYTQPVGGIGSSTAPTPSTATPGTVTYYVTQTTNLCESPRVAINVTVIAKPGLPTVVTPVVLCQNQVTTPLTATGTNLQWYTQAVGGTALAGAPTPSTAIAGNTTYYVSQIVNGCESDRASIVVTVSAAPAAPPVQSPVVYCQFEVVSAPLNTYVTGSGLLWYTSPSGGVGSNTPPVITTGTPDTVTYYVSQQIGSCESIRAALEVQILVKPQPPVGNPVTYCQYETAQPLTASGSNLLWYAQAVGGPAGSSVATIPATNIAGTFIYYVSQTVNGCESDRGTVTVVIKPQPPMPVATPAQYTYCQNDAAVTLTANGTDLLWYASASGGTGSVNAPTPVTTVPGTYYYYVTQTVNGCESERASIEVIVYATPAAPGVVSPVLLCEDDQPAPLTAAGQNLKWYADATSFTILPSAPVPATDTVSTTSYFVSQTVNGCESPRAEIVVQVNPRVYAQVAVSSDLFCQYDTISVQNMATNVSTAAYVWDFNGGIPITGSGAGPYDVSWNDFGVKSITVIVSNLNCSDTDTKVVTVKEAPHADFSIQQDACKDAIVTVQAAFANTHADAYEWNFGDAKVINGAGAGYYKLSWNTSGIKVVSLRTTLNDCRSQIFFDRLIVHDPPAVNIESTSSNDICSKDSVYLVANDLGANYSYLWGPAEFISDNGLRAVYARPQATGNIYLTVSDQYGCTASDSVFINAKPCCTATLPNAFTPNNDGHNDIFKIITNGHHEISSFRILNRWGQTVFETVDEGRGWDGSFQGVPQPMDTYNYFLRLRCADGDVIEKKGEVLLLR